MAMKRYNPPILEEIQIDSEISMIMMSWDGGNDKPDKPNHKPGCPCAHCRTAGGYDSAFDTPGSINHASNPFGGNSPFN